MITYTIEALLGVLLVVVLMQLFKKHAPAPTAQPVEDLANLKPSEARVGDALSVSGAGDDMTDLDFIVERSTWFQSASKRWLELSGPYKTRRVALRVDFGDDLETSVQIDPRKLTIEDLGLPEDDLAQMDERQNTADSFEFDGKLWLYVLSRETQMTRSDQPQPVGFYYWEFRQQDGAGRLAVRKIQGDPFAVTLYTGVPLGDVSVYRGRT
jgi:hypothetical protein